MSATLLISQLMHGRQMCTHHSKQQLDDDDDDDEASAAGFMPTVCVTTLKQLQQPSNWTGSCLGQGKAQCTARPSVLPLFGTPARRMQVFCAFHLKPAEYPQCLCRLDCASVICWAVVNQP